MCRARATVAWVGGWLVGAWVGCECNSTPRQAVADPRCALKLACLGVAIEVPGVVVLGSTRGARRQTVVAAARRENSRSDGASRVEPAPRCAHACMRARTMQQNTHQPTPNLPRFARSLKAKGVADLVRHHLPHELRGRIGAGLERWPVCSTMASVSAALGAPSPARQARPRAPPTTPLP